MWAATTVVWANEKKRKKVARSKHKDPVMLFQTNISVPDDEWYEEWTSDDFMALPELVSVAYENQRYNPKLQYLTGVARDDASYMICESAYS